MKVRLSLWSSWMVTVEFGRSHGIEPDGFDQNSRGTGGMVVVPIDSPPPYDAALNMNEPEDGEVAEEETQAEDQCRDVCVRQS